MQLKYCGYAYALFDQILKEHHLQPAPHVTHVIHIGPPSNLECYFQELGRAGRCGQPATATLYFNNSDVASNKTTIDDLMKVYCQSNDVCLRKILLEYCGFSNVKQKRCCCVCNGYLDPIVSKSEQNVEKKEVRTLSASQVSPLYEEIKKELLYLENDKKTMFMS